jgi:hypothetical protein
VSATVALLITTLAVGSFVGPRAAEAQPQASKVWRVGVLAALYPSDADAPRAFRQAYARLPRRTQTAGHRVRCNNGRAGWLRPQDGLRTASKFALPPPKIYWF